RPSPLLATLPPYPLARCCTLSVLYPPYCRPVIRSLIFYLVPLPLPSSTFPASYLSRLLPFPPPTPLFSATPLFSTTTLFPATSLLLFFLPFLCCFLLFAAPPIRSRSFHYRVHSTSCAYLPFLPFSCPAKHSPDTSAGMIKHY